MGDPYSNSFHFMYCVLRKVPTVCFHIVTKPNPKINADGCYEGEAFPDEVENHAYHANESLLFDESQNNRIIVTRTENVMPGFVANLREHVETMFGDKEVE